MSRTQRVDPRETGKFSKPRIKRVEAPGVNQFASGRDFLDHAMGQINTLITWNRTQKNKFSATDQKEALEAINQWRDSHMKLRELKALADGSKTPNLDELSAIYTAGETTEDITTKAYLFGILLKAANSNNKKIAAAAKECIVHVQEVELEV